MSSPANDGGPAFPNNDVHGCAFSGMTLRDWFAGMALQGFCAQPENYSTACNRLAEWSYQQADAMLDARERKEEP